jgi:hypothetical protein
MTNLKPTESILNVPPSTGVFRIMILSDDPEL